MAQKAAIEISVNFAEYVWALTTANSVAVTIAMTSALQETSGVVVPLVVSIVQQSVCFALCLCARNVRLVVCTVTGNVAPTSAVVGTSRSVAIVTFAAIAAKRQCTGAPVFSRNFAAGALAFPVRASLTSKNKSIVLQKCDARVAHLDIKC